MLYERVHAEASTYYGFIRKQMSMLDDGAKNVWNKFACYIRNIYEANAGLDKNTIYDLVAESILNISTLEHSPRNRMACGIITSFFIQNCEVFDEIAK